MDIDWHEVFEYRDGELFYKERPREWFSRDNSYTQFNTKHAGTRADRLGKVQGYYTVRARVNGVDYRLRSHRVVWEMFNGPIPKGWVIDHIDQCRTNNRIENLRLATDSMNGMNRKAPKHNSSGTKNVAWAKREGKWRVYVYLKRKQYYGGLYSDIELAELVATELREKLHGEFACHD